MVFSDRVLSFSCKFHIEGKFLSKDCDARGAVADEIADAFGLEFRGEAARRVEFAGRGEATVRHRWSEFAGRVRRVQSGRNPTSGPVEFSDPLDQFI
jgi:hypothetical protein